MSEQEMKSGGAGGSSVVLVEQSAASRHKQPFRPIDIQNEASHDSQNKRNKAPAVPSVAEDLKQSPEDRDRKENEHAISSEKHKHSFAKKLSSNKRRSPSPETITLAPLEVDTMKASITPLQPIPAQVPTGLDLPTKQPSAKKEDDESITEEIAGSRTPDVAKDSDEWEAVELIKKEVSSNSNEHLEKGDFQDVPIGQHCLLERKSSIGPCFRSSGPFGRPSGISVCLSKKPRKMLNAEHTRIPSRSVINITISKKCILNKNIPSGTERRESSDLDAGDDKL